MALSSACCIFLACGVQYAYLSSRICELSNFSSISSIGDNYKSICGALLLQAPLTFAPFQTLSSMLLA